MPLGRTVPVYLLTYLLLHLPPPGAGYDLEKPGDAEPPAQGLLHHGLDRYVPAPPPGGLRMLGK